MKTNANTGVDSVISLHPTRLLGWLLALSATEGILALAAILAHHSEPGARFLGPYSAERWGLILALAIVTLSCAVAAIAAYRARPAIVRLSTFVLGRRKTIPIGLSLLLVNAFALVAFLATVKPEIILRIVPWASSPRVSLMLPVTLWGFAGAAQLLFVWQWQFRKDLLRKPRSAADAVAVAALIGLTLAARVPLIGFGLPYEAMWDEVVSYPRALQALEPAAGPSFETIPGYGAAGYGEILVTLTRASSLVGLFESMRSQTVSSVAEYVSPPLGVNSILQAVHPSGNPLFYPRLLFALLNSFAPLAIYLVLRMHLRVPTLAALGGALPYAVFSWDAVSLSSFVFPDALATTLILFSLLFAFRGMDGTSARPSTWLVAGVLAGIAASTSMRSILFPLLPLTALLLSVDRTAPRRFILPLLGGVVAGYVLSSPSIVLDLPTFLARTTGVTWLQDGSLQHRIESLVFYLSSMFSPSSGLGLAVLALCTLGVYRAIIRAPRTATVIILFSAAHLYLITPVVLQYPRHSLVLVALVCLWAGFGLEGTAVWTAGVLARWQFPIRPPFGPTALAATLVAFLVLSAHQVEGTFQRVQAFHQFEPSQVQVAKLLDSVMTNGDKVGVQEELPFLERDLYTRDLAHQRVTSDLTVNELRNRGVTYVVGTDRLGGSYSLPPTGLWHGAFQDASTRFAEFGADDLLFEGFPSGNLFMFVARIPQ